MKSETTHLSLSFFWSIFIMIILYGIESMLMLYGIELTVEDIIFSAT